MKRKLRPVAVGEPTRSVKSPHMTREARWARYTDVPLMLFATAFLAAYAWPIISPGLSPTIAAVCHALTWIAWSTFVLDYAVRLYLANDRFKFVREHFIDLLIILLPLLRPLRLLRLVTLVSIVNRRAAIGLRGRVAVYVAGGSALLAFCASLAVLDAERHAPDATITTFGDAAWWAITTMTTVGYGDRYPVTAGGRVAAAALMVGGVAMLGVVTATLASWLVERVADTEKRQNVELIAQLDELRIRLDDVNAKLDAQDDKRVNS